MMESWLPKRPQKGRSQAPKGHAPVPRGVGGAGQIKKVNAGLEEERGRGVKRGGVIRRQLRGGERERERERREEEGEDGLAQGAGGGKGEGGASSADQKAGRGRPRSQARQGSPRFTGGSMQKVPLGRGREGLGHSPASRNGSPPVPSANGAVCRYVNAWTGGVTGFPLGRGGGEERRSLRTLAAQKQSRRLFGGVG